MLYLTSPFGTPPSASGVHVLHRDKGSAFPFPRVDQEVEFRGVLSTTVHSCSTSVGCLRESEMRSHILLRSCRGMSGSLLARLSSHRMFDPVRPSGFPRHETAPLHNRPLHILHRWPLSTALGRSFQGEFRGVSICEQDALSVPDGDQSQPLSGYFGHTLRYSTSYPVVGPAYASSRTKLWHVVCVGARTLVGSELRSEQKSTLDVHFRETAKNILNITHVWPA